jgi:hypothetical protein
MLDKQTALLIGSAIEAVEAANGESASVRPQLLHAISVRLDEERYVAWIDALVDVAKAANDGTVWADLAPCSKIICLSACLMR